MSPRPPGRVYFVQAEHGGPVKIGYTTRNVQRRLAELQCGSPWKLVVRHDELAYQVYEAELHQWFADQHLGGEWYGLSDELAEIAKARTDEIDPIPNGVQSTASYLEPGYQDRQRTLKQREHIHAARLLHEGEKRRGGLRTRREHPR